MAKNTVISMAVVRRLPKYHRYLFELLKNDVQRISSKEFSQRIGFTASQIRQDLNCFGDFGQQGYGYNVKELYDSISKIIGLDKTYNMVIVGAGNIGQAVANYTKFEKMGFHLIGMFDKNPKLTGMKIRDIEIQDVEELGDFLKKNITDIGVICIPKSQAQSVANVLSEGGVKGIWNFAPTDLVVPDNIMVENVHLSDSLYTLSYMLNEKELFNNIDE